GGFGERRRRPRRSPEAPARGGGMMLLTALDLLALLLAASVLAVVLVGTALARMLVYGICLVASFALMTIGLLVLVGGGADAVTLPLGIPWLGAHFRLDPL